MVRVGVLGAGGRMGQAVIAAVATDPRLKLAGAIEQAGHPLVGRSLGGGLIVCSNLAPLAHISDVLIDFTAPGALGGTLDAACEGRAALLIGTTGLGTRDHAAIDRAARSVAVLQAANTSLGVALLARLVAQAAARLGPDWDIEIAELHHGHKVDAPSGTALLLGEAAAAARGGSLAAMRAPVRETGRSARAAGHIGFASLRGGSAAGGPRRAVSRRRRAADARPPRRVARHLCTRRGPRGGMVGGEVGRSLYDGRRARLILPARQSGHDDPVDRGALGRRQAMPDGDPGRRARPGLADCRRWASSPAAPAPRTAQAETAAPRPPPRLGGRSARRHPAAPSRRRAPNGSWPGTPTTAAPRRASMNGSTGPGTEHQQPQAAEREHRRDAGDQPARVDAAERPVRPQGQVDERHTAA